MNELEAWKYLLAAWENGDKHLCIWGLCYSVDYLLRREKIDQDTADHMHDSIRDCLPVTSVWFGEQGERPPRIKVIKQIIARLNGLPWSLLLDTYKQYKSKISITDCLHILRCDAQINPEQYTAMRKKLRGKIVSSRLITTIIKKGGDHRA